MDPKNWTPKKYDPRINRDGRPKNFDALRELAREIGYEPADIREDGIAMNLSSSSIKCYH